MPLVYEYEKPQIFIGVIIRLNIFVQTLSHAPRLNEQNKRYKYCISFQDTENRYRYNFIVIVKFPRTTKINISSYKNCSVLFLQELKKII